MIAAHRDGNTLTLTFPAPTTEEHAASLAWEQYEKRTADHLRIRYVTLVEKRFNQSGLIGAVFTASITQV